ncbi:MAG: hypothetical protein ACREEH_04600, partial [Caulobacteraceae bacterium]
MTSPSTLSAASPRLPPGGTILFVVGMGREARMVSPLGPTSVGAPGLATRRSEAFAAIISFG